MITTTVKHRPPRGRIRSLSPPTHLRHQQHGNCHPMGLPCRGILRLSKCLPRRRGMHTLPPLRSSSDSGGGSTSRQVAKMEKLEDLVFAQAAYISSTARSSDTEALNQRMEKLEGMLAAQAAEIKVAKGKSAAVEAIERRVKDIENKVQAQNAQITKASNRVGDVESKVNAVEQKQNNLVSKLGNVEKTIPSLVTTKAADKYMSVTKQEIATLFTRIDALEAARGGGGGGGGMAGAGSPIVLTPAAKSGKPSPLDIRLEKLFMDLKHHPRRFIPPSPQSTPLAEFSFAPNSAPVPSQRLIRIGDPKQVLLFIDGSCIGSGSPDSRPGYGVYFRREDNVYGRLEEYDGDNNAPGVAEVWAAVIALQLRPWREEGFDKVVLACDAEYVVLGVCEWVEKWAAKGWKTGEKTIAGRDAWEKLLFELAVQEARGVRVQFWLIPRKLNLADSVARKGAEFDMAEIRSRNELLLQAPHPPPPPERDQVVPDFEEKRAAPPEESKPEEAQLVDIPPRKPQGMFGSLFGLLRRKPLTTGLATINPNLMPEPKGNEKSSQTQKKKDKISSLSVIPLFHPPPYLDEWPGGLSPSRLGFVRGLDARITPGFLSDPSIPIDQRRLAYHKSLLLNPDLDLETLKPHEITNLDFVALRKDYYISRLIGATLWDPLIKKEHKRIRADAQLIVGLCPKLTIANPESADVIRANRKKIEEAALLSVANIKKARALDSSCRQQTLALKEKVTGLSNSTINMVFQRMVWEPAVVGIEAAVKTLEAEVQKMAGVIALNQVVNQREAGGRGGPNGDAE